METPESKMKVEIWSDVVCPFCYIGKRKFESALKSFIHSDSVELEWKSFQLSPDTKTDPSINIHQYLAAHKGINIEQAKQMNDRVTEMAKLEGLTYDFDSAIAANTFNAHRLLHFAKHQGKQGEAKERLMRAYFTEGKNIDDIATLMNLGAELGLDRIKLKESLENNSYAHEVSSDIGEAQQLGIRGVPFFVFDRKYAISGAQDMSVFSETLEKSFAEWKNAQPEVLEITKGDSCDIDGNCE